MKRELILLAIGVAVVLLAIAVANATRLIASHRRRLDALERRPRTDQSINRT